MTTALLLLAGIYVIIFGGLIWASCTASPLKPCGCRGFFTQLNVYDDDLGEREILIWKPDEDQPRKVRGRIHTYKAKCRLCGQVQLMTRAFPPPEEESFR